LDLLKESLSNPKSKIANQDTDARLAKGSGMVFDGA
jgi:hypothetical protein